MVKTHVCQMIIVDTILIPNILIIIILSKAASYYSYLALNCIFVAKLKSSDSTG